MGVIYKLNEDVVNFILTEKKANPTLSCRRLVELIREKFQVEISKSAVNEVIKNASLSSPVGRTPLPDKKSRRFKIPDEKKMILFSPPMVLNPETQTEQKEAVEKDKISSPISLEKNMPPQDEKSLLGVSAKRVLYDCMGAFFLKAAQWQLDCFPILGKMLNRYINPNLLPDINLTSEALLFSPIFGIEDLGQLKAYDQPGLWALNGLDGKVGYEMLVSLVNGLMNIKEFSLTISNEIPQIFTEVGYIKIILEDKNFIIFDAKFRIFGILENVQSVYTVPLKNLFNELSKKFLINVQSIVLNEISEKEYSSQIYQLIAAFENFSDKRIKMISLLDENNKELASFTAIPQKRRFFILEVVPPYSNEINFLLNKKLNNFEFKYKYNNKIIEFCEEELLIHKNNILCKNIHLRCVHFQEKSSGGPFDVILITNIEKKHPHQKILEDYLKARLNLEQISKLCCESTKISFDFYAKLLSQKGVSFVNGKSLDIWLNINILLKALSQYCQRHFFPETCTGFDMQALGERFYRLPGYLEKDSQAVKVSLKPAEGYSYRQDLEHAIQKVNASHVQDHSGKRLILAITT